MDFTTVRQIADSQPLVLARDTQFRFLKLNMRFVNTYQWYKGVAHLMLFTGRVVLLALGSCFAIRLSCTGAASTSKEQLFVCNLLFSMNLYSNFPSAIIQLRIALVSRDHHDILPIFVKQLTVRLIIMRDLGLMPLFTLYFSGKQLW